MVSSNASEGIQFSAACPKSAVDHLKLISIVIKKLYIEIVWEIDFHLLGHEGKIE
jgi:hypothetical protein